MTADRPPVTADRPHLPRRPLWLCRVCAAPWPCVVARETLLAEYGDNRGGLSVHLCTALFNATRDLHALNPDGTPSPRDLYARFIGWAPRMPL